MERGSSLPHSQEFATCHCPEPVQSSSFFHPTSLISIVIWCSHLRHGLPSALFPSGFHTKTLFAPHLCYVLQSWSISCFFSLSSKWYVMRSAVHRAPRYVVFSTPLLPRTSPDIFEKFGIDISVFANWGTVSVFESGHKSSVLRKVGKLSWDEIRLKKGVKY